MIILGTVQTTNNSGIQLQLDDEDTATTKRYKRLSSYTPAEGDRVLILKIAGTYVILGKVV